MSCFASHLVLSLQIDREGGNSLSLKIFLLRRRAQEE
jgi:hypothetical protein